MRNFLLLLSLMLSELCLANPCSVVGTESRKSQNLLEALTQYPTPAFLVTEKEGRTRFIPPAKLYAEVLNLSEKSLIINNVEELRFLSQTLARSEVLMVLKETSDFNFAAEKAAKVSSVTKLLGIRLNLVWIGESIGPKVLRDLVEESGGHSFETRDILKKADEICKESLAGR